jgi:ribosomal protein S18 acetylase RimI-like enzyme
MLTQDDVPAAVALINEATPQAPVDEAELRRWIGDPAGDVEFGLFERDGVLTGYADVSLPRERRETGWIDLRIPLRFLADDVVDEAVSWAEQVARDDGRPLVRTVVLSDSPLADHLRRLRYRPIRASFRMRVDLDDTLPSPVWPAGLTVSSVREGEERTAWEVSEEAFADHWEFTPTTWEQWAHHMLAADAFDAELFLVARSENDVAGVCICRPEAIGRPGVGWIRILAVRRPWRRRGLGRALLLEAFARFRRRGALAVGLGVDGENTTGAVHLYESAGMHVELQWDIYERRIDRAF